MTFELMTTILVVTVIRVTECQTYQEPSSWQPYSFGYSINDGYGNEQSREENSDANGYKRGSYGYTDANGIYRKVDYVADDHGFRASISTNEPGTSSSDSADVHMSAHPLEHPARVVAAPAHYAIDRHLDPPVYRSPIQIQDPAPIYSEASNSYPIPFGTRRIALSSTAAYTRPRVYHHLPVPEPYLPIR